MAAREISHDLLVHVIANARAIHPMPDNLSRIEGLFTQAISLEPGRERMAFIERVCGRDKELRRHLLKLLEAHRAAGEGFLSLPDEEESGRDFRAGDERGPLDHPPTN